jgi:penicillin-binding protein 1A
MKKFFVIGIAAFLASVLIILSVFVATSLRKLPNVALLKHYRPAAAAEVSDKDGNVLTQYFDRKFRIWVPIKELPDIVIKAVVTAEDDTFFEHHGVNYKATWDALILDVQKHRFARGGSTITQQMIKNVFLSKEKTISRKLREYVLARKAEEILTKRQILQIYLNEVEWGENIYGIEAASRYYLDKHASELTIGEAALLAGMLPNPRYYNPAKRPSKARDRQERVLFNMQQAKLITQDEYATALAEPLKLRQDATSRFDFTTLTGVKERPCYQRVLEQLLTDIYGEHGLYRSGMTIKTTLDKALQDEVSRQEMSYESSASKDPDRITALEQGGQIRAIACDESREADLREKYGSPMPLSGLENYSVNTLAVEAVTPEQIILSASSSESTPPPH